MTNEKKPTEAKEVSKTVTEKKPDYKTMNIYEKMSEITNKLNRVAKNLTVGAGKSEYRAVGEADILVAVKPIEHEYRVYSFPLSRNIVETNIFVTETEYYGKVKEKNNLFLRIETVYRFLNIDNPSEFVDITSYGDGFDGQDKSVGKAMTYSDKYALMKAYKIETGDDPDQNPSQDIRKAPQKAPQEAPESFVAKDNPIANEFIGEDEINALKGEFKRTGIGEPIVLKEYGLELLSEMRMKDFYDCTRKFEQYPTKKTTTGIK